MSSLNRLLCLVLLIPVPAAAQRPLDAVAGGLRQGQKIRVHAPDRGLAEGRFAGYSAGVVQLRVGDATVPVGGLDSLWVRRSHIMKGALIGGLALGAANAGFWVWACGTDDDGCEATWVVALTAGAVGAGAVVGGLIGAAASGWDLRWADGGRRPGLVVAPLPERRVGIGVSLPLPGIRSP